MGDFQDQPVPRCAIEPIAGPSDCAPVHRRGDGNRGRHGPERLIIAQDSNAGEYGLPDLQLLPLEGGVRRDAVQEAAAAVGVVNGPRPALKHPAYLAGAVHKPETHAAIAGGKSN